LFYKVGTIAVLLIVLVVFLFDKETKTFNFNKLTNFIGLNSDQKVIEKQIENVYFGLMNGAYTAQGLTGTTPENLPFYNSDLSTLMVMGFTKVNSLEHGICLLHTLAVCTKTL
jgi:hypothetical protein